METSLPVLFVQRGLFLSGQARAGEDTTSLPMLLG